MLACEGGDLQVAIYNVDGASFATDNVCTHAYAILTERRHDAAVKPGTDRQQEPYRAETLPISTKEDDLVVEV